jgi:hypothetical protein
MLLITFIAAITAVAATGIIRIPAPVSPEPSSEKSALLAAIDLPWEESAIVAAKVPSREKPAIVAAKDPPLRKKPAIVAAVDPPSREKPAIIAASVWEAYVHGNPTTAAPTPAIPGIPALCNSVRWIPNCQRDQCAENGDALPHESLLYLGATPRLMVLLWRA